MNELLQRYPALSDCKTDIERACQLMLDTYKNKGKILVCGNSGSAANENDLVIGISTSGNSKNIVNAMR